MAKGICLWTSPLGGEGTLEVGSLTAPGVSVEKTTVSKNPHQQTNPRNKSKNVLKWFIHAWQNIPLTHFFCCNINKNTDKKLQAACTSISAIALEKVYPSHQPQERALETPHSAICASTHFLRISWNNESAPQGKYSLWVGGKFRAGMGWCFNFSPTGVFLAKTLTKSWLLAKKKSVNTVNTMPLTSINFSTHETYWHSQKISDPNGNVAGASVTSNMLKPHLSVFQDEDSFNW